MKPPGTQGPRIEWHPSSRRIKGTRGPQCPTPPPAVGSGQCPEVPPLHCWSFHRGLSDLCRLPPGRRLGARETTCAERSACYKSRPPSQPYSRYWRHLLREAGAVGVSSQPRLGGGHCLGCFSRAPGEGPETSLAAVGAAGQWPSGGGAGLEPLPGAGPAGHQPLLPDPE